ncbi:MAG: lipopolysaccharide biosynthesis protein [Beutenbergiaceae bacterium]
MASENLLRGGLVSLVGSASAALAALVLTAVVGQFLGPAGTGVFFQAIGIFTVLTQVLRLGTNSGMVRFMAAERAHGRAGSNWLITKYALVPVAVLASLASIALWFWSQAWAQWLASPGERDQLASLLRLMAPFVLVAAVAGVLAITARMVRGVPAFTMLSSVLPALLRLAAVVAVLLVIPVANAAVTAWLVPLPLVLVLTIAMVTRPLLRDRRVRTAGGGPSARSFWRFSAPRALGSGFETGLDWADILIVAALASPAQAGIYAVCSRAVKAGQVVDRAMRVAVSPTLAALLARAETETASALHARVVRAMVVLTWPFYLVLAVNGAAVLTIFGAEFAVGAPVLSILAVTAMVQTSAGMLQSILLQGGRSSWQMMNKGIALAVCVAGNLLLVPLIGIVGAALSWALVIAIDTALAARQVHSRMGVHLAPRKLLGVAAVATGVFGLGGLALRAVAGPSLIGTMIGVLLLGCGYLGLLWLLRRQLGLQHLWARVRPLRSYL